MWISSQPQQRTVQIRSLRPSYVLTSSRRTSPDLETSIVINAELSVSGLTELFAELLLVVFFNNSNLIMFMALSAALQKVNYDIW